MSHPIQIAGVHDWDEAKILVDAGVTDLGFPLRLDKHKEDLSDDEARKIVEKLPASVRGVLITYLTDPAAIVALSDKIGAAGVQLHGPVVPCAVEEVRRARPKLFLMKSLIVEERPRGLEERVKSYAPHVDAFLTDTFDPATGALGATGKTHDWSVSRALVEQSPKPIVLAGGLTPDNVARAIEEVRPWGVDSHTGVEGPDGRKDPEKVRRFVAEARRAFSLLDWQTHS